ncbi:unnamed protein product [Brugia timori]|uniref:Uncharacterized protein n=1 Tax=Brugia timori TaxID=42155 RepID=A0A0R3QHX4_9BILA|nr:unnamed protein product [Brugia timori]
MPSQALSPEARTPKGSGPFCFSRPSCRGGGVHGCRRCSSTTCREAQPSLDRRAASPFRVCLHHTARMSRVDGLAGCAGAWTTPVRRCRTGPRARARGLSREDTTEMESAFSSITFR